MQNPFKTTKPNEHFIDMKNIDIENIDSSEINGNVALYIETFRDFILQDNYPCVGAQASVNSNNFCMGIFNSMLDYSSAEDLAFGLYEYVIRAKQKNTLFLSFIAVFKNDIFKSELEFEKSLWLLFSNLHNENKKHFNWNPEVSNDPEDSDFSYSFGGEAFFAVGMHPESKRLARKFPFPAIAFNLHSQFEELKNKDRFRVMKKAIRNNELEFQGSINPMLSDFGEDSEAKQYSGRRVKESWKCPFKH